MWIAFDIYIDPLNCGDNKCRLRTFKGIPCPLSSKYIFTSSFSFVNENVNTCVKKNIRGKVTHNFTGYDNAYLT